MLFQNGGGAPSPLFSNCGFERGVMKYQFIASTLLMAAACSVASAQVSVSPRKVFEDEAPKMKLTGKPVARVNGAVLTDRDLLREMYAIFPYARQHNGTFPQTIAADIRRGALLLIEFAAWVYEAA